MKKSRCRYCNKKIELDEADGYWDSIDKFKNPHCGKSPTNIWINGVEYYLPLEDGINYHAPLTREETIKRILEKINIH